MNLTASMSGFHTESNTGVGLEGSHPVCVFVWPETSRSEGPACLGFRPEHFLAKSNGDSDHLGCLPVLVIILPELRVVLRAELRTMQA